MAGARVVAAEIFHLRIPLRSPFVQSHNVRATSDNLVVAIRLEDGTIGYGEGVPRSYVTGESPADVWSALIAAAPSLLGFELPDSLVDGHERITAVGAEAIEDGPGVVRNAARAAVEVAMLDALTRRQKVPLHGILRAVFGITPGKVAPHSLVLGRLQARDRALLVDLQSRYRFRAAKVKVGFGLEEDLELVRRVREALGPEVALRVDVNRAWSPDQAVEHLQALAAAGVEAAEDPVGGDDLEATIEALRRVRRAVPMTIVIDEAARTPDEFEQLADANCFDVMNLRVSKNGGLLPAGRMAAACARRGVAIQVGCQAAETAILSAAGRALIHAIGDVRYVEGSNEHFKWAPTDVVCSEDLHYPPGAACLPLAGSGLGIEVHRDRLYRLADGRTQLVSQTT